MAPLETPVCAFGDPAPDFRLPGTDGQDWALRDCAGPKGMLVMFICNHCPYVKAIQARLVEDTALLQEDGIGSVAIMSNDPVDYPEDSFENMQKIAREFKYPFPYLFDKSQAVARAYGAVCTPDFFGYNAQFELQYRGRLDSSGRNPREPATRRELVEAMRQVAETGKGPARQSPSMGCSIKWQKGS